MHNPGMTLQEYLTLHALSGNQFAKRSGACSVATINRLQAGQVPKIQTIRAIEEATNGQVSWADWLRQEPLTEPPQAEDG